MVQGSKLYVSTYLYQEREVYPKQVVWKSLFSLNMPDVYIDQNSTNDVHNYDTRKTKRKETKKLIRVQL